MTTLRSRFNEQNKQIVTIQSSEIENKIVIGPPRGFLCEDACKMWCSIYNYICETELYLPTRFDNMNIRCCRMMQLELRIGGLRFSAQQQRLSSPALHLVLVLVLPAITKKMFTEVPGKVPKRKHKIKQNINYKKYILIINDIHCFQKLHVQLFSTTTTTRPPAIFITIKGKIKNLFIYF